MTTISEALAPRSDRLNADDLIPGPRTITFTKARIAQSDRQLRIILNYEGDNGKPFEPCKTMGRAMVMVWGITDDNFEDQFVGKSVTVYRDPEVSFGDQRNIGGVRISHMSHIDAPKTVKLTVTRGKKSAFVFKPLTGPKLAVSNDLSQDQARCDIANAATLDELKTVWARKAMAPHREALQADLDARKSALTDSPNAEEGRADEDHGDQHDGSDEVSE